MKKKITSILFSLIVMIGLLYSSDLTACADVEMSVPESETMYFSKKNTESSFGIYNIYPTAKLDMSSVKSSNPEVASVSHVYYSTGAVRDSVTYGNARIFLKIKKAGNTKIFYNIGGVDYTTDVTTENKKTTQENPLTELMISGIGDGKNIADIFDDSTYVAEQELSASQPDAKVSITAKDGYLIDEIYLQSSKGKGSRFIRRKCNRVSSCQITRLPLLKDGSNYSLTVVLRSNDGKSRVVNVRFM